MYHNLNNAMVNLPLKAMRELPRCESPDEHGAECRRPGRRVFHIVSEDDEFPVVVCDECAVYLEKEARNKSSG